MLEKALNQSSVGLSSIFPEIKQYDWLHFRFEYKPMAKQSFKFSVKKVEKKSDNDKEFQVNKYTPIEQIRRQTDISWDTLQQLKAQKPNHSPYDCPVEMKIIHAFEPPKNFGKKRIEKLKKGIKIYMDKRPDLIDNLNKILGDAMQGIVYTNDSRIAKASLEKIYSINPYTEIWVRKLPDEF